ncbi:unnamed protein product [Lupinus luteus]|uniref:Uncharacterized protein n=1 Tax=Lupinus luteus TaxID=3873 RepID=A0AAV1XQE9_LUPLU
MNEEDLPKQQSKEETLKQPQKRMDNLTKIVENQEVDLVINLEIDRSTNINIEDLERVSSPIMPHASEDDGDPTPQSQNVRVVDGSAQEEQNMIQQNQVEEFEILNQATNSNALAAQESRLVGRLWADDEMPDEEIEISDQPAYTKVLSKSQKKKAEAKA